jgi:AhpD family alkylhydroperoxidase
MSDPSLDDVIAGRGNGSRMSIDQLLERSPDMRRALVALEQSLGSSGGLEFRLAELAFLRASVVNGCGTCIRRHASLARRQGINESTVQSVLLDESHAHGSLTPPELAIIRFVDALSASPPYLHQSTFDAMSKHFENNELVDLALIVAAASALNRLVLTSRYFRAKPRVADS